MNRRRGLAWGLATLLVGGCYQGEWKIGLEVPVGSREKLLATRDVESWELEPTPTPYVVRLKADLQPKCRTARFGSSRRTDVGRFTRVGGQYWKGVAIASSIAGGAAALTGGSGWISREAGPNAVYGMLTVGGLIGAGGLVNCILALQKSSPVRWGLCGSFLGAGAAMALGAGLSMIGTDMRDPMDPTRVVRVPTIGTEVFQGLTYAGAGALGLAGVSGVTAALWRGQTERTRVVETPQTSLWERQQGEQTCGPARPLVGRTATLEISTERTSDGPGSEGDPLRLRVALGEEGLAVVDLRPLRQALPSCGVLRVQVNPDTLYEQFVADYVPPQAPEPRLPLSRPIHGRIQPPGGITLQGLEGKSRRAPAPKRTPGFSEEVLAGMEKRCRVELARGEPQRGEPARFGPPAPGEPQRGERPPGSGELEAADPPEAASGGPRVTDCSPEMRQTILRDCEHSCGKTLEAAACVFDKRKCTIDARYSQQKQRDLELCDLAWEKCLFKSGVSPGAWSRCVDACQRKNESSMCQ